MIKLFQPYISDDALVNVQRVLRGTQLAEGPEVKALEQEFAHTFGFEPWQIVAVNSGTSALELAYDLTDITNGSRVLTPVLTCTATNLPLVRRGAKLLFVDVEGKYTLNIDTTALQNILNVQAPEHKASAIVFVHFGGSSAGLPCVEQIAEANGIDLICDAAQALGAPLSRKARFSTVSLQAIKSLTAGDGGVLICRDKEDAATARRLRWYGYDRERKQREGDCDLTEAGYKYHMNDILAAIARGNLAHWQEIADHRAAINGTYKLIAGDEAGLIPGIWNPSVIGMDYKSTATHVARPAGFEIGQHHYRNDKYTVFKDAASYCPNMDAIEDKYFMLPCHMGMTTQDAEHIAHAIWRQ